MRHGRHPVRHLNATRADDLLTVARAFGGHRDATAARAERIDGDGIDVVLATPHGERTARISFGEPVVDAGMEEMRAAFGELTRRARAALAGDLDAG
jgi:putative heme iron utilization protein